MFDEKVNVWRNSCIASVWSRNATRSWDTAHSSTDRFHSPTLSRVKCMESTVHICISREIDHSCNASNNGTVSVFCMWELKSELTKAQASAMSINCGLLCL